MRARRVVDGAEQRGDDYDWRAAARALFLVFAAERAWESFSFRMMGAAHCDASFLLYEAAQPVRPTAAQPLPQPLRGLPMARSYTLHGHDRDSVLVCAKPTAHT